MMESLGNIQGELLHRHFNDDTFTEFKSLNNIGDLVVITYHPLKSLYGLLKFLNESLIYKSSNITLIFGLSNIPLSKPKTDTDRAHKKLCKTRFDEFVSFLSDFKHLNNQNLKIYLHTRCHIKALCADDILYLGTQNVSATSNSFIKNALTYPDQVFNNHELVLRVNKLARATTIKIKEQLIKDEFSCLLAYTDNAINTELSFEDIIIRNDKNAILEEFQLIKAEIDRLKSLSNDLLYSSAILEQGKIETQQGNYAFDLILKIYEGASIDFNKGNIEDLLLAVTGESNFKFCEQINCKEIIDKISSLSNLDTEVHVCSDYIDEITSQLDEILECIEEPQIANIEEEDKEDLFIQIKKLIEDSYAHNLEAFFEHHRNELENYLLERPGECSNKYYVDNDEDDCVLSIIPINEISNAKKLDILVSTINYLVKEILSAIYSNLEPQADEIINKVQGEIESIAETFDKHIEEHLVIPERFERFNFE